MEPTFPPETTQDPDTCTCDVSKYDMEAMAARLDKLESQLAGSNIGSLESTVNDVLNGVTTMEYDTTKMEYPETTEMDYETTMKAIETTMMQYETTKMEMPETTMADTTMADTTMMETTMKETTMMETTMADTTMMATTEEIIPTEVYEMYGYLDEATTGNKCPWGSSRTFKLSFTTLEGCVKRCYDDANCKYATTEKQSYCIGCKVAPTDKADGWYSYKTYQRRRKLTAQEALKIENAALRARLEELTRN